MVPGKTPFVVLLAVALAGCIGESGNTDTSTSSSGRHLKAGDAIDVMPGRWLRIAPLHDAPHGFRIDYDVTYEVYDTALQDSYECVALGWEQGWLGTWAITQRDHGPDYVARRDAAGSSWIAGQAIGYGLEGGVPVIGSDGSLSYLLAHDKVGPMGTSDMAVQLRDDFRVLGEGPFWCLTSVSRYTAGQYLATPQSVDATGLRWSASVASGIHVRVVADAEASGVELTGPQGQRHAAPAIEGPADLSFCSSEPGEWRLDVASLRSSGPWRFDVLVLDIGPAGVPCTGEWAPTRIVGQANGS